MRELLLQSYLIITSVLVIISLTYITSSHKEIYSFLCVMCFALNMIWFRQEILIHILIQQESLSTVKF